MTIRQTAYETTACSGFVTQKIINALEDSKVNGYLSYVKDKDIRIVEYNTSVTPIPSFFHPIIINDDNNKISVVDVRSSGKYDDEAGLFRIRNQYEYNFITIYAELNNYWVNENPRLLLSVSPLPVALYARWMSENITRRFGLNPQDQLTISILAAFFYVSQFTNEKEMDIRELQRVVGVITKATYSNAETVLAIIENRPFISDIKEFCELVKEITGNVRLDNFNVGILSTILGNTWYGNNAKELVFVAMEFPPAWILLAYSSYVDRSYKDTGIAKMSSRDKKQDIDSFIKSLVTLIRTPN